MLGHLYWFHSWGCYLGCISEAYLINGFVVHWFPSDDREFVVPSLGNFFFGYELGYSELGSVGYHY
jgi:hypothetical protein